MNKLLIQLENKTTININGGFLVIGYVFCVLFDTIFHEINHLFY